MIYIRTSRSLRFLQLILASLLLPFVLAQDEMFIEDEPVSSDVDRILNELEEESSEAASSEEQSAEVVEQAVDTVPSIRLQDDRTVEGMELQSTDNSNLISISLDRVQLADVVRIFARSSGANIIIPDGLDETVSANLQDVDWRQALEVILADKNYVLMQRRPGIYAIARQDQLASEPLASETLELQFITVENALPAVQGMIITSNARVTPLPAANVLLVTETPNQIQEIKRVLTLIDRPRDQVFIEAKFVELNDQAIKDLGINWQVLQGYTVRATGLRAQYEKVETTSSINSRGSGAASFNRQNIQRNTSEEGVTTRPAERESQSTRFQGSVSGRNIDDISDDGILTPIPDMVRNVGRAAIMGADDFALTLSALQQLDGVRIVSNPKMLVANGQTASIHVGRNEPNIRALPQGENATSFAYVLDGFIEIGVKLEVTPKISTSRNITVNIIPELSRLIGEKSVGEAGTSFPVTSIRRINTEFALDSGKTVAIGGLTQGEDKEVVRKIPLLGDLPLIGKYLFRHTRTERYQDEVVIFVSVDMAHVDDLDNSFGIPQQGELIHRYLLKEEADRLQAELNAAAPAPETPRRSGATPRVRR